MVLSGSVGLLASVSLLVISWGREKLINRSGEKLQNGKWEFETNSWNHSAFQAGVESKNWSGYAKSFCKPSAYLLTSYYAGLAPLQRDEGGQLRQCSVKCVPLDEGLPALQGLKSFFAQALEDQDAKRGNHNNFERKTNNILDV